ncbi:Polysulphide reductase NrfD [Ferroglobus placidus DSM 10642]|uniref:Polysulphide reductase NrfD n=1 Tax=Ferroglobus placidus (strain DSM 10642 / AEDII12DO) TaxID=589924 RepID=D3RYM5_FERPA|nr:NrfD/PsrC family molybdoenzyme membrane anchor subunit [Ferroglobus placidus]ADC65588.1 Polysulphide reductase NrfD [Ferroglobus placidus DSM 10642]
MSEILWEALKHVEGFIYPNEVEINWSVLIAVYPYITGLVAGAFIVASLERIFKVEAVKPTYRLALLTALAFLLCAPLPLVAHLGRPERAFEIMTTPHLTSAMAGFGFVYAWYLLIVLLTEIYYDYRRDIIRWAKEYKGIRGFIYRVLTLGEWDDSEEALKADQRVVNIVTIVGLPSAALLHGYVGFIFGSVKANIWWSSPLMPIIFLFSAMVSGIALVLLIYIASSYIRGVEPDKACTDTLAGYLLYSYILDLGLEAMELIHIFYTQEEGFDAIVTLISDKIFVSFVIIQIFFGTLVPIILLLIAKTGIFKFNVRKYLYIFATVLTLIGVFAMRWNVVIGGQILSKTYMGYSYYIMPVFGPESLSIALAIMALPFVILAILVKILPPWEAPYVWEKPELE